MKTLIEIDHTIFHFINDTITNPFLDWFMPLITNEANLVIPLTLLWLWLFFFCGKRGKITAVLLLITVAATDIIAAQVIKPWIGRIRPSHSMVESINLLVPRGGKYSFVSNHAANTMAAATVVGYFFKKWKWYTFAVSIIVGFSRVYVGVHYPFDVIGGWIFGYAIAWLIISIWVILKIREIKRGKTWTNYT